MRLSGWRQGAATRCAPRRPAPGPALAEALAALHRLLRRRRWLLRGLVVLFGGALLACPPLLLFAPLTGLALLLLLPPAWGLYLVADALLVQAWRRALARQWRRGAVNLGIFAGAVATLPHLPAASTGVVLRSLPVLPPLMDRDLSVPQREALCAASDRSWAAATLGGLLAPLLLGLAGLGGALAVRGPAPVLFLLALAGCLVLLRFGIPAWLGRRLVHRSAALPEAERAVLDHLRADGIPAPVLA